MDDYYDPDLFTIHKDDDKEQNPFERMARRWEEQSRSNRIDPDRPSPKEIKDERMCEFWMAWEKSQET